MRVLAYIILLSLVVGCVPAMKYGLPPNIDGLDTLKRGISAESDILEVLGEPRGYGQVRYSSDLPARKIWFYEYTEAEDMKVGLKILLVFLDEEVYDGHLWFSSAQFLEIEEERR
jgi:hypothetical protein